MYQMYGTEVRSSGMIYINAEDNLKYITAPVNANWHLNFGPSFSFLTSAESTVNGSTFDIKDGVKSFQLGLSIGIGYKIEISEKFGIDISYNENVGLTEASNIDEISFKNSHSAINVAAVFKLD